MPSSRLRSPGDGCSTDADTEHAPGYRPRHDAPWPACRLCQRGRPAAASSLGICGQPGGVYHIFLVTDRRASGADAAGLVNGQYVIFARRSMMPLVRTRRCGSLARTSLAIWRSCRIYAADRLSRQPVTIITGPRPKRSTVVAQLGQRHWTALAVVSAAWRCSPPWSSCACCGEGPGPLCSVGLSSGTSGRGGRRLAGRHDRVAPERLLVVGGETIAMPASCLLFLAMGVWAPCKPGGGRHRLEGRVVVTAQRLPAWQPPPCAVR
jgi:hypothetical protein